MRFVGTWRGYWEQVVWGRQPMRDLVLRFDDGRIEGRGVDVIGSFTFSGTCDDQGNVAMVKQYVRKHAVAYHGTYDGEGTIRGRWSIGEHWSGPFALTLDGRAAPADAPVIHITADSPRADPD